MTYAQSTKSSPWTGARNNRRVVVTALGLVGGTVVVALTAKNPLLTLAAGVVALVVGLTLRQPAALPILILPASLVVARVGGGGTNLSVSDVVLFLAFWPAVLLGSRPFSAPLRSLLWASALYQALTIFTVIANPYVANAVEWWHAWLLVSGALLIGWAVGSSGHARLGLGLIVAGAAVLAVETCVAWAVAAVAGDFGPTSLNTPFFMQKNYLGTVIAFAAIIVYARPLWLSWNDRLCSVLFVVFGLAIAATQSRQALVSLAVAVAVVTLRPEGRRQKTKAALLGVAASLVVVAVLLRDQLASTNQFNSAHQRLDWFQQSLLVWQTDPWFGAGLRWWYTDRFAVRFQPPNAEFEVLSSAGVVGLLGFLLMFLVMLIVLWRVNRRFGTLAASVVLMRLVQGQFDLFWVAVQASMPFLIAGVCLGAMSIDRGQHREPGPVHRRDRSELEIGRSSLHDLPVGAAP